MHFYELSILSLFSQHKDPFDRLIISSAIANNFKVISADGNFKLYKDLVEVIS